MAKAIIATVAALILVFSATLFPGWAFAAATTGVTVTISADKESYGADDPVIIHVTITNPSGHPLKVLKWHTPAEDVEGPLFSVRQNGLPVSYIGPLFKRPKPVHDDYVNLKAGESISRDIDLARYYDLTVSANYSIRYDVSSWELYSEKGNSKKDADSLISNELRLSITGRGHKAAPAKESKGPQTGAPGFTKCTAAQQNTLIAARQQAVSYSANASAYLNTRTVDSRYTTWFGNYNDLRYGTATSHFNSIASAMETADVTFDCGCKKNYYAYVYPDNPYVIYLCRIFWMAPLAGTDSKAGTLIHEMSHFYVVAGTLDHIYGQAGAKSLAISDPAKAVTNADSHEYFAENTPYLP